MLGLVGLIHYCLLLVRKPSIIACWVGDPKQSEQLSDKNKDSGIYCFSKTKEPSAEGISVGFLSASQQVDKRPVGLCRPVNGWQDLLL